MSEIELKKCPFCGSRAKFIELRFEKFSTYEVECSNEECEVSPCTDLYNTKESAAAVWNKREVEL